MLMKKGLSQKICRRLLDEFVSKDKKVSDPTVFLIEEDSDARFLLRESLKADGYKVSLAIDEEDALERARSGCVKADLILINLLGKSIDEVLETGRNICRTGRLSVPLVVIAQNYGEDLAGTNVQINENEFVTYLEDGGQLFSLVSRLTQSGIS